MAITAKNVLTIAREQLNDLQQEYRYSDPLLIKFVANGQRDILRRRRDAQMSTLGTLTAITDPTLLASTLVVSEEWLQCLADYVTWRCLAEDSADKESTSKAKQYFDAYEQGMAS